MLALLILLGCTDPNPTSGEWSVVWEDDFEGSAGEAPDPAHWAFDVGGDGWGNNQLEYDTDRAENASLDGSGNLVITAIEEEYEGNAYTSARLKTLDLFEHGYGRYEARIKLPNGGKGIWPAFWLLGNNYEEAGWPWCGEVDIMEFRGSEPETVTGTIHGPGYSGALGIGDEYTLEEGDFTDDFHTFAVEIDPGHISWLVDDVQYQRISRAHLPDNATWVFDMQELENDTDGFFIILNLAVGGHYDGDPDDSTTFPTEMVVDWVRVSERAWTRAPDDED